MLLSLWMVCFFIKNAQADFFEYSLGFFQRKEVSVVTGIFCSEKDVINFAKRFSLNNFLTNAITVNQKGYLDEWANTNFTKMGVVADASCNFTQNIIEFASKSRLMNINNHWLIYADRYYTLNELEAAAERFGPEKLNVQEYLDDETYDMEQADTFYKINNEINSDILEEMAELTSKNVSYPHPENQVLKSIMSIDAIVDSEVTLAIPSQNKQEIKLYEIFKQSFFTKMTINPFGTITDNRVIIKGHPTESSTNHRTNFNKTLIRVICALHFTDHYARTGELTAKRYDRYFVMGRDLFLVIEEMLNFRGVIKYSDDYGWFDNGTYTGMIGFFMKQKIDMTSQTFLITNSRLPAVDFISCDTEILLGLTFRVPSLAKVANIFVLPFSKGVWYSLGIFFLLATILHYNLLRFNKSVGHVQYWDSVLFFTSAICQQGNDIPGKSASIRLAMTTILLASLFLFISYSANIVTLLQSKSESLNSVNDIAESSFLVGVQNILFVRKLIEDDKSAVMEEFKRTKITPFGKNSHTSVKEGLSRIKNGMFALQADAAEVNREVNLVFNEHDKCGLKFIQDFKGAITGGGVPKKGPLKEILKQKYLLLKEHGFVQRTYLRWTPNTPVCDKKAAYEPVDVIDVSPIFIFLMYGILSSFSVFILEVWKHSRRKLQPARKNFWHL